MGEVCEEVAGLHGRVVGPCAETTWTLDMCLGMSAYLFLQEPRICDSEFLSAVSIFETE